MDERLLLRLVLFALPFAGLVLLAVWPRASQAIAIGLVAGFFLAFPGAFVNPLAAEVLERAACEPGQRLVVRSAGKGAGHRCADASGRADTVYLWSALVGFDVHYPCAAVVAGVVLAVRARRRRAAS